MIYSMTGFGRIEDENEDFQISMDLRAVNHKYLDIQFKAPYFFKFAEDAVKNKIKEFIKRGRIEVYFNVEKKTSEKADIKMKIDTVKCVSRIILLVNLGDKRTKKEVPALKDHIYYIIYFGLLSILLQPHV